jgi:hypothetical protein
MGVPVVAPPRTGIAGGLEVDPDCEAPPIAAELAAATAWLDDAAVEVSADVLLLATTAGCTGAVADNCGTGAAVTDSGSGGGTFVRQPRAVMRTASAGLESEYFIGVNCVVGQMSRRPLTKS